MSMPFMATGTVVKDYQLLIQYFEEVKSMGMDPRYSYPTSSDIEFIVRSVRSGAIRNLYELLESLTRIFSSRVCTEAAIKAFKKKYGSEPDPDTAVREIAWMLAGWTIEIAESLGLISLRNADYYLR